MAALGSWLWAHRPTEWKDVGALATTLALIYALYRDLIREWLKRPKLRIEFLRRSPDFHRSEVGMDPCYVVMMRVRNVGASRATNVQMFPEEVSWRNSAGEFVITPNFLPMPLMWAIESGPTAEGISPKSYQLCSLGIIMKITGPVTLTLLLAVKSNNRSFLLQAGHYRVRVRAEASNASSVVETLEFKLSGDWFDDEEAMFTRGFTDAKLVTPRTSLRC